MNKIIITIDVSAVFKSAVFNSKELITTTRKILLKKAMKISVRSARILLEKPGNLSGAMSILFVLIPKEVLVLHQKLAG